MHRKLLLDIDVVKLHKKQSKSKKSKTDIWKEGKDRK